MPTTRQHCTDDKQTMVCLSDTGHAAAFSDLYVIPFDWPLAFMWPLVDQGCSVIKIADSVAAILARKQLIDWKDWDFERIVL